MAEPELCQRAGSIVLDEHVGGFDQLVHHRKPALVLEIDTKAALAHVLLQEIAGLSLLEMAVGAASIAALRSFDLDDIGTHRREAARRMRAGQEMAVVDDPDAGERQVLAHDGSSCCASGRRRIISLCSPFCTTSSSWLISSDARLTMPQPGFLVSRIAPMRYFTCSRSPARIGLRKSQVQPSEAPGGNCRVPWVLSPSASDRPNNPCATMPPKCEAFANSSSTCTGV